MPADLCPGTERNLPINRQPEFSLIQARLCPRPLAYGKGWTRPIGARHNGSGALSIDSVFLSKDIARYRKIGLTQLSIPANHIERYLRPTFDTFYRMHRISIRSSNLKMHLWPIRFGFQNAWNLKSFHDSQNAWNLKSIHVFSFLPVRFGHVIVRF